MAAPLINFAILLGVVIVVFIIAKRPLYEAMALAFLCLLACNGSFADTFTYLETAAKSSILYTIILFLIFSSILKETGVIKHCIDIIIALVGRVPGGAGVVALVSSAFIGAMSGSGPGNVAATGSVTIPLMKKAGYSPEFSAGVAMSGSCLSPVIPPSATIIAAFACLTAVAGYEEYPVSDLWIVMYAVSAAFIIQRLVQFYIMYAISGFHKLPASELPSLKDAWKRGWKSFMLVPIIMLPFVLDNYMADWFKSVLGAASAKHLSSCVLFLTPAIAAAYSLLVSEKKLSVSDMAEAVRGDLRPICSLAVTLFLSYAISALLQACDTVSSIEALLLALRLPKIMMVLLLMFIMTVLGMFISGTSLIPLLGPVFLSVLASYGISPVLTTALIPALFVSLGQMTPPFAVCMYAAIGIAQSDFNKTCVQAILWSLGQFLVLFLLLMGIIPIGV